MLSQIWWVLLHVDHFAGVSKWISWEVLWGTDVDSLIGIEGLGELITVNDTEDSAVDIEAHSEFEVRPVISLVAAWFEELVSLEENSLWNS